MEIFFCEICGRRVSEAEIQRGDAFHEGADTFCLAWEGAERGWMLDSR